MKVNVLYQKRFQPHRSFSWLNNWIVMKNSFFLRLWISILLMQMDIEYYIRSVTYKSINRWVGKVVFVHLLQLQLHLSYINSFCGVLYNVCFINTISNYCCINKKISNNMKRYMLLINPIYLLYGYIIWYEDSIDWL